MSVCTLKQSNGGTSCGFTNMKSNRNMSRCDCECSPIHKYRSNQSKWAFSTYISDGVRYVFLKTGEWVTNRVNGPPLPGVHSILQWRHKGRDGVSNHQPHDYLLKRIFRHSWKKTSKLHVTGLCEGNSPVTGEFPAQRASNAEKVSI